MKKNIIQNSRTIFLFAAVLLTGCATQMNTQLGSAPAVAQNVFPMPAAGNDIVGQDYQIRASSGETFTSICQTYDIGAQELMSANPHLNPNRIYAGSKITIPAEYILPPSNFRKGIVINTAEMRLYYFDKNNNTVMTFPVAVGREGWGTPLGNTYVYRKEAAPTWNVPKSIRDAYLEKTGTPHPLQIGPGPENPLGEYAIYLHLNGYLIHGTNAPNTIGRSVSSGCIRMFNFDVAKLFDAVNRGTPVSIISYPTKAGWKNGQLYVESHPVLHAPETGDAANQANAAQAIQAALAERASSASELPAIQTLAQKIVKQQTGLPTPIGMSNNG